VERSRNPTRFQSKAGKECRVLSVCFMRCANQTPPCPSNASIICRRFVNPKRSSRRRQSAQTSLQLARINIRGYDCIEWLLFINRFTLANPARLFHRLAMHSYELLREVFDKKAPKQVAGLAWRSSPFCFSIGCSSRPKSSSESRVASLVGQEASIVTPIPENGVGEIAYIQGGSRYTAPARTESGSPIPPESSFALSASPALSITLMS